MTNIIVKPTITPQIQVEIAQIKHPTEDSIDNDTSFVIITDDGYELFRLLTKPHSISTDTPKGCYISKIEYDPLIIGSEIINECMRRFLTSIRYSMHFIVNRGIEYKYEYLWYDVEDDISCIIDDYIEFENIDIDAVHLKITSISH